MTTGEQRGGRRVDVELVHRLFRELERLGMDHTRTIRGHVAEIGVGQVKVRVTPEAEPVWVDYDGITAIGAPVAISLGTDGKPLASSPGEIPPDLTILGTGPTGERIIDQALVIDQTVQELTQARAVLDEARDTLAALTDEDFPLEPTIASALYAKLGIVERLVVTESFVAQLAEVLELDVEQVRVGRDIRFTSSGLVFYAPPAQGQDPSDWPNRTPLISMTPTGTTSIAVAKEGKITAGITPEGHVWATEGNFDRLIVGGYGLGDLIGRMPRGVLGMTRVSKNVSINNVANPVLSVSAKLYRGRLYTVDYALGMARSAGEIRVRLEAVYGSTTKLIGEKGQSVDGEFASGYQFTLDEYSIPDGTTVELRTSLRTSTSGATGTLWGFGAQLGGMPSMRITDQGPTPPIYVVEGAAPPAPPATWYGPEGIPSGAARGIRPDGSNAPDTRLTIGGYSLYGTDMAEHVWFPVDFSRLNGSTVRSATVALTFTQSTPTAFRMDATGGSPLAGRVNIYNGTAGSNGQFYAEIPASLHQNLVGKGGILLSPFTPGSGGSYGYVAGSLTVNIIYSK